MGTVTNLLQLHHSDSSDASQLLEKRVEKTQCCDFVCERGEGAYLWMSCVYCYYRRHGVLSLLLLEDANKVTGQLTALPLFGFGRE